MLMLLMLNGALATPSHEKHPARISVRSIGVRSNADGFYVTKTGAIALSNWIDLIHEARGPMEIGVHQRRNGEDLTATQGRADAIVRWLVEADVPRGKMVPIGYGGTYPLVDDDAPDAHKINSRVELRLAKGKRPKPFDYKRKEEDKVKALAGRGPRLQDEYGEAYVLEGKLVKAAQRYRYKMEDDWENQWAYLGRAIELNRDALAHLHDQGPPAASNEKCEHYKQVRTLAKFVRTYDPDFELDTYTGVLQEDMAAALLIEARDASPAHTLALGTNCRWGDSVEGAAKTLLEEVHEPLEKNAEKQGLLHAAALHARMRPYSRRKEAPAPPASRPLVRHLTRVDANDVIDIGGSCSGAELRALSFSLVSTGDWDPPGGPPTTDVRLEGTLACTEDDGVSKEVTKGTTTTRKVFEGYDTETKCSKSFSITDNWDRYIEDGDWVYLNTTSVGVTEVCQNVVVGQRWGVEEHTTPDIVAYQAERRRNLFGIVELHVGGQATVELPIDLYRTTYASADRPADALRALKSGDTAAALRRQVYEALVEIHAASKPDIEPPEAEWVGRRYSADEEQALVQRSKAAAESDLEVEDLFVQRYLNQRHPDLDDTTREAATAYFDRIWHCELRKRNCYVESGHRFPKLP